MTDPFTAQARADRFVGALREYGSKLDRGPHVDALLERAESFAWEVETLAEDIRASMPVGGGPGLVIAKLQALSASPRQVVTEHQRRAMTAGDRFYQPRPPCGRCDGSRARWLDVTPRGHLGQTVVTHCPSCWTMPPNYVPLAERHRRNRDGAGSY